ncbi:aldehyde-activating protein [Sinisalibacter aestuarii]|uniref:Aldehyde-activating protein n=2 Tax=Sinisalibacter aestuarii TaxID=2949426 RepID=A0ABQ5LTH1_9RHOB|nr:aldehyde-activating protein [Sinisalibacter aestuarii]
MLTGTCHCGNLHWSFDGTPDSATACNCTLCRRYGVLWIYDWEGEKVTTSGTSSYYRWGDGGIEFHFCPSCGNVGWWRGHEPHPDGRTRIAVNVRLSEPDTVGQIPIRHFDGLNTFTDLPSDGRCVADMWA